ncbi:U-box domain-containing protein 26-like isoform X2 [Musa acuminata AAA Group]|uniref:U-box domain-containing protein 26-like isoform X2 n=1 Tax=Musa acuminata AAA Group TaxID=214697 RepID=UPI0031D683C1
MSIPYLFRCPISLDLFTDPVTLSTGQTYDRPSIEKWLADGNLTCPVTMQRLTDTTLIPNHTLRHLIHRWLLADPGVNCRHRPVRSAGDSDAGFSLLALKQKLQSSNTSRADKLDCLEKLLFQYSVVVDSALAEAMLDCVLSLLASAQLDSLDVLKEHARLTSLELLLDQGNTKTKTSLCHLLKVIAASSATRELCVVVGESRRVLQALVSLLHDKSSIRASEAAVRAISGMCSLEPNRSHAIRGGVVDGLVSHLSSPNSRTAAPALATLELLLTLEAGKKALVEHSDAIKVLVKMVFRMSTADHEGSEHALGSLLAVCCESEKARSEAMDAGVMTQLLLLLQSQCSSMAKAKARDLLKLMRSLWTEETRRL